jgi:hypothetical protein
MFAHLILLFYQTCITSLESHKTIKLKPNLQLPFKFLSHARAECIYYWFKEPPNHT